MKNHLSAADCLLVEDDPRASEIPPPYRSYVTTNPRVRLEKYL